MIKTSQLVFITLLVISGCGDKEKRDSGESTSGMKCGAGKCGTNMIDGNSALDKKKKNILSQMQEDDKRQDCVLKAMTTKAMYDCVRNPTTGKLSLKCGSVQTDMKCGSGKCGGE